MPNHVHYIIKIVKFVVRAGSPRPSSTVQGSPRPSSSAQESPRPFPGSESPHPNIENNQKFLKGAWEQRSHTIDNRSKKWTLGQMIAYFKYKSTKQINELRKMPGFSIWQRGFYDRLIRNDAELNKIRQYILDNPKNWDIDKK
jgi:REP element-mobilizing transposase RayT